MLALVLALLVTQADPETPSRPKRADRVQRVGGRTGGASYAFFEAFPANGAGAGAVAPYPNWIPHSEVFSSWILNGSATAPTVTDNQTIAPDGTLTADKVDFAATSGVAFSFAYQNEGMSTTPNMTATGSVYVKGVSTDGIIDICHNGGNTCLPCSFTSAAWTRCTVSFSWVTPNLVIGNNSLGNGGVARPAQSVYLWGAMWNAGSVAGSYSKVVGVAYAGPVPTGAKGEPLSFARSSTAYATRTATGGLSTTGIANGDLVLMPANQPRVEYDSNGVLGLLVEASRTNSALRSEEFENAVWAPYRDGTPVVPVVTANAAVAPDGTTTADRLDFASTTGAQSSIIYQSGVLSASAWSGSVYVKGVSGSGTIDICLGTTSCGQCSYVSTSWTRCVRSATASGTLSYFYGNASFYNGSIDRPAQSVYLWGGQAELGAYATSYIPTGAGAATRGAEFASFPLVSPTGDGSVAISSHIPAMSANGGQLSEELGTTFKQSLLSFSGVSLYVGATSKASAVPSAGQHRVAGWWSTSASAIIYDGVSTSGTAGAATAADTLRIGNYQNAAIQDGIFSRVCRDPDPSRCR